MGSSIEWMPGKEAGGRSSIAQAATLRIVRGVKWDRTADAQDADMDRLRRGEDWPGDTSDLLLLTGCIRTAETAESTWFRSRVPRRYRHRTRLTPPESATIIIWFLLELRDSGAARQPVLQALRRSPSAAGRSGTRRNEHAKQCGRQWRQQSEECGGRDRQVPDACEPDGVGE